MASCPTWLRVDQWPHVATLWCQRARGGNVTPVLFSVMPSNEFGSRLDKVFAFWPRIYFDTFRFYYDEWRCFVKINWFILLLGRNIQCKRFTSFIALSTVRSLCGLLDTGYVFLLALPFMHLCYGSMARWMWTSIFQSFLQLKPECTKNTSIFGSIDSVSQNHNRVRIPSCQCYINSARSMASNTIQSWIFYVSILLLSREGGDFKQR